MAPAATARATGAQPSAHPAHLLVPEPPEGFWYSVKCRVLGPPLVTGQLATERLSRPLALGVLSCDGLSSAAYGTEEILYALLPFFGLAAFTLVLPLTLLVLFGVLLVVLSYREVVSVYTRAGGSYVVARENFGPRVAQVDPIGSLRQAGHATVQGRLRAAEIRSSQAAGPSVLACEVADSTGELTAVFLGRAHIAGIEPGNRIRLEGQVGIAANGRPTMINPAYELLP
jgi:hypothetical protein